MDHVKLLEDIKLPSEYDVRFVIALGYPKEDIIIKEIYCDDDIKYYRDKKPVHHIPKIRLEDLIIN